MSLITGKSKGEIYCTFTVRPHCPDCGVDHDCHDFDTLAGAIDFLESQSWLCYDCEENRKAGGKK